MRIPGKGKRARIVVPTTWAALALGTISAQSVTSDTALAQDPRQPSRQAPAREPEKTVAFEMRDKPWPAVIEWLVDQSGLPFIGSLKPTGTFNFIAPKSQPDKRYTISQVIDILNEGMSGQNLMIVRRSQSFTIVDSSQKIDPALLPRLSVDELDQRGESEMANVVLPLKALVAEDEVREVKPMLGPFGDVSAMTRANQLILTDTVKNLKRVIKTIQDTEDTEKNSAESYSHVCKYIKARDAEKILRDLLGDPKDEIRQALQAQGANNQPGGNRGGGGLGQFFQGFGGGQPGGGRGGQPQQAVQIPANKLRMHYVSCDERTCTVFVTGPADILARARAIMRQVDLPSPGQVENVPGDAVFKQYTVPGGNAETVATTLKEIYKSSPTTRITAIGNTAILAYAFPDDQLKIAKHISNAREDSGAPEVITLNNLDASRAIDTLKGIYGNDPKTGAPYLEADPARNAVVVKGTVEQIKDVKEALKALGEATLTAGGPIIISLPQGGSRALAEELERLLSNVRPNNPVKINNPGGPEKKPENIQKQPNDAPKGSGGSEEQEYPPGTIGQIVDPQAPAQNKTGAPIVITPAGNSIIISSNDPEALKMANSLIRLLTQSPKGDGDFEIIRLKNALAADAAKVLDEAFNGTKATPGQNVPAFGPAAFFRQFNQQQQSVPTNPTANRIRVVADAGSNSLLVRASPLDMLAIKRLLEKAIDSGLTDSTALIKRHLLPPLKHANVLEVAATLRDVYREQMNPVTFSEVRGPRGRGAGFTTNLDANGNPITVALTLGVDDRNNQLLVSCSDALFNEIKKLVKELDDAAAGSSRTVELVSIKGVDPLVVQQAIDAIQGRRTPTQGGGGGFGGFGNPGGGFGGGFGGFGGNQGGMGGRGFGGGFGGGGPGFGGGGAGFGGGGAPAFVPMGGGNTGFVPGAGGGGRGGFGGGGGPGGGGGGGPRGGGGFGGRGGPGGTQNRGPDFFEQGVMDDPRASALFDPQHIVDSDNGATPALYANSGVNAGVQQTGFEEQQQPPTTTTTITGPRSLVTVDPVGGTDLVIINTQNKEDMKLVREIIKSIEALAKDAELVVKLVPLKKGDATSVAYTLAQMYSRVRLTPSGNVLNAANQQGFAGGGFGANVAAQLNASSIMLLPVPRYNAIFVGAPRVRMPDVEKDIGLLDQEGPAQSRIVPYPLKKAPAARVGTIINNFWSTRYPNLTTAQVQTKLTWDDSINTLFIQAAPVELAEITELIDRIENTVSSAVNELRIVPLKYALADEITNLLNQAINSEVVTPTLAPTTPGAATPGGALPGGGGAGGPFGQAAGAGLPAGGTTSPSTATTATSRATKSTTIHFVTHGGKHVESGILEDIHISPDERLNALVIAAPHKSMELVWALIQELDSPPANRAEIKVFPLKKADATTLANTIAQLYFASTTTSATPLGGGPGGGGGALGTAATGAAIPAQVPQAIYWLYGTTPEGAPLVALHMAVDVRTNSIMVAGGRNDLDVINALISRIEDQEASPRVNEVYQLHSAFAADVASSLQTYFTNSLTVLSNAGTGQYTSHEIIERNVVIVPDPVSNRLLISASPDYLPEVIRVIMGIDLQPPQVMIQVLVAEVDFSADNEFGVEIGMQSPVLFQRSIFPQSNFFGGGNVTYTTPAAGTGTGLVPPGVTVTSSTNPAALPGFLFNSTAPLGNNPVVSPGVVGFQGITNLGVGRASPTSGVGGFVFSAGSDAFNILVRALQTQGRIDILSRPQLQATDNQTSTINIGQQIPYIGGTAVTATGVITNTIDRTIVGVNLQVTPHISPDGTVMMRVTPQVSSPVATQVSLGNGTTAIAFNVQQVDTTVTAEDGQTVVIGGLITSNDTRAENKVPWLGDLPYIGTLFRYRTETKTKSEILVIMTPHIIRCRADADRVAAVEADRMHWIREHVRGVHETTGMEPYFRSRDEEGHEILPHGWFTPEVKPAPGPNAPPANEALPKPRQQLPTPQAPGATQGAWSPPAPNTGTPGTLLPADVQQAAQPADPSAADSNKEKAGWSLFRQNR
jgi:type II secretion system protein D